MNAFDRCVLWLGIRFLESMARHCELEGEHLQAWRAYRVCERLSQMRSGIQVPYFTDDQTERFNRLAWEAGKLVGHHN